MKIGLIGFNQTGKTSLFELLTGKGSDSFVRGGKGMSNIGTAFVPDERVDFLSAVFKPKKTIYAKLELTDVPGFTVSVDGQDSGAAKFLNDVRPCDALIHVLRAFDSDSVIHDLGSVDPARDFEALESEMLFADLEMIEKRIARIRSGK
jgi:ribosome-binding ATPase YchF (GTP1/OBG family)